MLSIRIWDLPTRLFHWVLAACVIGLVVSGHLGGNAMVWHFRLGYAVLTLLLFRLVWGFVGGHWSRWTQLPLRPGQVLMHLRGPSAGLAWAGHNPLGSWSVILMLLWLLVQVGTGLVSDDEISNSGPLTALVSGAMVSAATAWHKGVGKLMVILLTLLHVTAIVWYRMRKNLDLVPAMLHGDKSVLDSVQASRDNLGTRLLALVVLLVCAGAVRWLLDLATV